MDFNGKTLYVTDLDGTLMKNDETVSAETVRIINELVKRGLAFTFATARSIESARPIAGGLKLNLPVITRNGAVLADNATGIIGSNEEDAVARFLQEHAAKGLAFSVEK
jgi:HAD superfamily hydrolase (TIGR01484 family)